MQHTEQRQTTIFKPLLVCLKLGNCDAYHEPLLFPLHHEMDGRHRDYGAKNERVRFVYAYDMRGATNGQNKTHLILSHVDADVVFFIMRVSVFLF